MPEPRMSAQLARLAKKRGRLPALVTALCLAVLIALQQFLQGLATFARKAGYPAPPSDDSGLYDVDVNPFELHPTLDQLLFFILPLTLGIFLALWVIAPISHELTLRFVLTRAGLASAAGVLLVVVFQTVQGLVDSIGVTATEYPWRWSTETGGEGLNFQVFGQKTLDAIHAGASTFIFYTPVVMLAGALLWLWLRDHPREYDVSGLIDEV